MRLNQINRPSHSYFKYTVELCAVTTVALAILKYKKPDALSHKWLSGCGATTFVLGLDYLRRVRNRQQDLKAFKEQLSAANKSFSGAEDSDSLGNFCSVEYNKDLHKICENLTTEQLSANKNELSNAVQIFKKHAERQNKLADLHKQLEEHNLGLMKFPNQLTKANQRFDDAKSLDDFLTVECSKELIDACKKLDAADNEFSNAVQIFKKHTERQNTLADLHEQLGKYSLGLMEFQNQLTKANQRFKCAEPLDGFLAVECSEDLIDACKKLDADQLNAADNTLAQARKTFNNHIETREKISSISKHLETHDLTITELDKQLIEQNELFEKAKSFEDFLAVEYGKDLYKICENLEKNQEDHPEVFLNSYRKFAEHMKLRLVFESTYIEQASFITTVTKAFDLDLDGFLIKTIDLDENKKTKRSIIELLIKLAVVNNDRKTQMQNSKHWKSLLICAEELGLTKRPDILEEHDN